MKTTRIPFLFVVTFLVGSLLLVQAGDTQRARVVAQKLAPCYSTAQPGALPAGYVKAGDTCYVEDIFVDTSGTPWFQISRGDSAAWSPTAYWRYAWESSQEETAGGNQSDADRKRRLRILREHSDWPRRIVRAVRDGKVCLDMTGEQMIAAWGEPTLKVSAFALGLGEYDVWLYGTQGENVTVVAFQQGRVIGWSRE